MKALSIYYTMRGRTKKTALAIGDALTNYEVTYFPVELTGKFIEKIKQFDKFEKGDFSAIEPGLSTLDAAGYDLLLFGMPTYGSKPPSTFDEIIKRMAHLSGKKAIIFVTARFSGGKALEYMKESIEAMGAQIINKIKFRRLFYLGVRKAKKFGQEINENK
ncbi:MAG TPA: hypothetical protein VMZ29_10845 [Candidatus Bathyarchaeia archaeon]|nr:hypothetical protein [Candidatus Bathyarchaeia archaeon]